MVNKQLFSIFFICIALSFYSFAQPNYAKEVLDKIALVEQNIGFIKFQIEGQPNANLQERMAYYHIKGLSIAVINNYQIEWAKGYGWADSASQRPVTTETLFEPGSISKSLNALGVLKLAQNKKLDLNTDINNYLVSWKFPYDAVSKNKKITVANLLSHTGGLTVHGFAGYFYGDSLPTILQTLSGKRPANNSSVHSQSEPGLRYQYSGGGIMISQMIVMDLTQQAYDKYMWENVLAPIGMANSSFTQPPPENKRHLLAAGYTSDGKEVKGKYPIVIEQAAGGLWTTPTDLCKFILEMQLSLQGRSNKVLSQEMTKKMLTPYVDGSSALGVFIEKRGGVKYFQHGAGNQGFRGKYYGSFEDGKGIAIIVNSDNSGIIDEVIASVTKVYAWKGFAVGEKPVMKKVVSVPDSLLNKYVGVFKQNNEVVTITKKDNCLWYQASGLPWKIYFTSESNFFSLESKSEKQFYLEGRKVKGFKKSMNGKELGNVEKVQVINLPDSISEKYVGTYEYAGVTSEVTKRDNSLWINSTNTPVKMNFISNTQYYTVEDFGIEYRFVLADRAIIGIAAKEGTEEALAKKVK